MDFLTLAIIVLAAAVVVLVAVLVPAVWQLRCTLTSADRLIKDIDMSLKPFLDNDLKPMVNSITNTMGEMEVVVKKAREGVEMVDDTIESVHQVSETIRYINDIANSRIKVAVIDIAAYITGLKVGLETLVEIMKLRKKEV